MIEILRCFFLFFPVIKLVTRVLFFCLLALAGDALWAQDGGKVGAAAIVVSEQAAAFDKQSLALRTALHYDQTLQAALKSLIDLYEKAGRGEDLLALYRSHISQYSEDVGAKVVLIRLMRAMRQGDVGEMVLAAEKQHPKDPELKYLLYLAYKKKGDARALKTLSQAIDLQSVGGRRELWLNEMLAQAQQQDARQLAEKHLKEALGAQGHRASSLLALAKQMHRYQFDDLCLLALAQAEEKNPDTEMGVEIELLAARAEAGLGQYEKVANRMDTLLKRLAPDYHRRSEIMKLRVSLVKNGAGRESLLEQTKLRYEKQPSNESAVLEYAEILSANEMRRKALQVLLAGARRLPKSESLEKEALHYLDRLGDEKGLLAFLQERLKGDADRDDLRYRLVKVEYLLGENESARLRLGKIMQKLSKPEQARRLLDLARYLRQRGQHAQAAELLERVVKIMPERLDVQRELLEAWLVLKQRRKAEQLLAGLPMAAAEMENFVDLLQFMVEEDFLVEARDALLLRLKSEQDRLDLNLLLVTVLGKTGEQKRAEEVLMKSRATADTSARYAQWLQVGMDLFEMLEQAEQFFDAEQFRFLEEGKSWTADRVERFLLLCELGEKQRMGERVAQALRNQLADPALPSALKLRLRLLLVRALDKSPDHAAEVEEQLELLAKEDGKRVDSYQLRRALLYHSNSRPDLARALLEGLDIAKVGDESILRAAYLVLLEYSLVDKASICLQKLTEMEPSDMGSWEKRLSLLAALGEEQDLRAVLRHLLGGDGAAKGLMLKNESLQVLRVHLLDSYWRSVSSLLKKAGQGSLAEILLLLDLVDRDVGSTRDRSWSLWTKAYVLNRLERTEARDAVIAELKIVLESGNGMIAFPDGLAMSSASAEVLLMEQDDAGRDAQGLEFAEGEVSEGPLGALEMSWAFEADPRARILQISPAGEDRVLVLDDVGKVYCLDVKSGKLLWGEHYQKSGDQKRKQAGMASAALTSRAGGITISNAQFRVRQQGARITMQALRAPYAKVGLGGQSGGSNSPTFIAAGVKKVRSMLVDGEDHFFLSVGNKISSYRGEDGALLWQADLALQDDMAALVTREFTLARPDPVLFLDGEHLLCYAPSLDVAVCFEKNTGKLIWLRDLTTGANGEKKGSGLVYSLNSGAAFSAGRMLVFGKSCEILDAKNGETLWSFDDRGVNRFPVKLQRLREEGDVTEQEVSPDGASGLSALPSVNGGVAQPSSVTFIDHSHQGGDLAERMREVKPFLQGRGALVAPAVQWNSLRGEGQSVADAAMNAERLLLMGERGLQEICLKLPIGANRFATSGVFLGTVGDKTWWLNGQVLTCLSLSDHQRVEVMVARQSEQASPLRAVLSGARIYVSGDDGLTVLNAYNGRVINRREWPKLMKDFLLKKPGLVVESGEQLETTWQGYVRNSAGRPVYCFPLRDRVQGTRLFTMVSDTTFVMLQNRDKERE
ncbi:MAG: PQQ-binding-like beta-propeller repeat protein [Verrucomicrobiales bacterium]|nr:PQQ-binding-like beta-propeller repeat protein [Verrucomicrobiales bacterium]